MTTYYVDSASGSNTSPYDTWAKAATALGTVAAIALAGDTIYVASTHSETGVASQIAFAGTQAAPTKVIVADKTSGAPPATAATGALQSGTGASSTLGLNITGYVYGYTFQCSANGGSPRVNMTTTSGNSGEQAVFEKCLFDMNNGNGRLVLGVDANNAQTPRIVWKDCNVKFNNTVTQQIDMSGCDFVWNGGAISAGSATLGSVLFSNAVAFATREGTVDISSVDLTNLGTSVPIFDGSSNITRGTLRNCKLPASWSGTLKTGTLLARQRFEMFNCDSGSTNYRLWIEDFAGSIKHETTLVKTGGASDGTTALSWKMASSANAKPQLPLRSSEIVVWNDTAGSSKTVTVDILHDSATNLKNNEVWVEVQYLKDSGDPLGQFISDDVGGDNSGNILATAADQTASSGTWTTSGMANPNKQKLEVTFTPQKKGFVHAVVCVGKASYTLYVDPVAQVS